MPSCGWLNAALLDAPAKSNRHSRARLNRRRCAQHCPDLAILDIFGVLHNRASRRFTAGQCRPGHRYRTGRTALPLCGGRVSLQCCGRTRWGLREHCRWGGGHGQEARAVWHHDRLRRQRDPRGRRNNKIFSGTIKISPALPHRRVDCEARSPTAWTSRDAVARLKVALVGVKMCWRNRRPGGNQQVHGGRPRYSPFAVTPYRQLLAGLLRHQQNHRPTSLARRDTGAGNAIRYTKGVMALRGWRRFIRQRLYHQPECRASATGR